ncbi:MAG: excinuclease ABC subunit UvrC, partial [Desulfomonilaceae bacterium]
LSLIRTQRIESDGEKYFGPYASARDARVTLHLIRKLFPLRQCTDRQLKTCTRPCLNCQMKRCMCPCTGNVDPDEYRRMVNSIILLLEGKSSEFTRYLQSQMQDAANNLRFEEAARLRDRLASVRRTLEIQNVSFFHQKDQDVVALETGESDTFAVAFLSFRKGNLISEESFVLKSSTLEKNEILTSALKQFYGSGASVPKEVFVSSEIEQRDLLEAWLSDLRGSKVVIRIPIRGEGRRLMGLALKNAENALLREKQKDSLKRLLERISTKLDLGIFPHLIECYDISNFAGNEAVGAKVSFLDGKPNKTGYRKFRIRDFKDQDDPGMIYQTISRRLQHPEEDPLPDLMLIDGGKSQLNAAVSVLQTMLGSKRIKVASIAKQAKEGETDKIYVPNRKNPVTFKKGDSSLLLLMRIRDEAHRFVLSFHKDYRKKKLIRSSLDQISGIGPAKQKLLLNCFGSVKGLLEASDYQIKGVRGISETEIRRIRDELKKMSQQTIKDEYDFRK